MINDIINNRIKRVSKLLKHKEKPSILSLLLYHKPYFNVCISNTSTFTLIYMENYNVNN
jgi:hypothetical protein